MELIDKNKYLRKMIYGFKIGSLWVLEEGIDVVKDVHCRMWGDCNIILDMQKWPTDIPDIVQKQVERAAKTDAIEEIIASPMGGGRKSLEAFVDATKDSGMRPLCDLEMAHPESHSYLRPESSIYILRDAASVGIDGCIIPATKEPRKEIKMYLDIDFSNKFYDLYSTGYKIQGGQTDAMRKFGVTKFIIGRYTRLRTYIVL